MVLFKPGELEQLLKKYEWLKAQQQHDEFSDVLAQELNKLSQEIQNGQSTGDPINDFLIVTGESEDSDIGKRLYALQKEINENQGQKVLVLTHYDTCHKQLGCFGEGWSSTKLETFKLGVINGSLGAGLYKGAAPFGRSVSERKIAVPTSKYYEGNEVSEGPILISPTEILCIDKWDSTAFCSRHHYCNEDYKNAHRITILTGDKTVNTYFTTPNWLLEYDFERTMTRIKKNEVDDTHFNDAHLNNEALQSSSVQYRTYVYVKALKALGLEVPANFQKVYDAANEKRRKEILEGICKTAGEIQKPLDRLEKELKGQLAELVELGIHEEVRKITLAPGLEIDLPLYLKYLCKKYNVQTH